GIRELNLFRDAAQVLGRIPLTGCTLMLLDLHMPGVSGQEILKSVRSDHPEVPVIVVTGDEAVDTAVQCMKLGAFDYLTKPVEPNRLWASVRHALEIVDLQKEVGSLSRRIKSTGLANPEAFAGIVTQSESMSSIFRYIEAVAPTSKPILVSGESGTGKELIAGVIHSLSRREGPFVAVNVAGLDETMFSDSLFGHVRGAFTGAEAGRSGLVEKAAGGTLFLDEIGDLAQGSQVKLLRLVQEGEYYPLGTDQPRASSARIVAATNADLREQQEKGSFRRDLYFRLIAHQIEVPPLRERFEDLPLLVEQFLAQAAAELNRAVPRVPAELYAILETCGFPGNIRELQSMLFDALSTQKTGAFSLAPIREYLDRRGAGEPAASAVATHPQARISYSGRFPTLKEAEEFLIGEALKKTGGNQSLAARLLGVNQSTLSRRRKKALPEEG
ncbi:MAG: sigma-54-dependent Fis family transcriptional regulator, partial [Spirochaetales bacterium]|nr:sigma-54-dependent Fis family transcriptional regulator [Spirochaetales bacterium]